MNKRITMRAMVGLSAAVLLTFGNAHAQTATANFTVSLEIVKGCTLSVASLDFGQYGVLDTALNGTTNLSVTCTESTPYALGLSSGNVSGSTIAARLLGDGTNTVDFQLYQPDNSTVWGDTDAVDRVTGTGTGSVQTHTINGRVPAQSTPPPATYSSTVTATAYF